MSQWEYTTMVMGTPDNKGRRWVTISPDPMVAGKQVGEAQEPRLVGRLWKGIRLLETALKEMHAEDEAQASDSIDL